MASPGSKDTSALDGRRPVDWRRWARVAVVSAMAFSLVLLALDVFAASVRSESDFSTGAQLVRIVDQELLDLLSMAHWVWAIVLLAAGIWAVAAKAKGLGLATILYGLFGWPVLWFVLSAMLMWYVPWTAHGAVRGPDGQAFRFLDSSFLQGQTMALGAEQGGGRFTTTYRILGTTNGDWPRRWTAVIRPQGSADSYGQLYINQDGIIVGIRSGSQCYFTYDTKTGLFSGHPMDGMEPRVGDVGQTSPFVLLDPATVPQEGDVDELLKLEHDKSRKEFGSLAPDEVIRLGLSHGNPRVRDIAGSILEIRAKANAKGE